MKTHGERNSQWPRNASPGRQAGANPEINQGTLSYMEKLMSDCQLPQALLFEAPTFQVAVMLNQLSLLFLYRRVFTLMESWFRYTLYAIGIFCIGSGVALFFAGLFHCMPLNHGWNPTVPGHCRVNIQALYITATVLNLVGDISIVAAPIPLIWSLQMNLPTKGAVTVMFLLGGL